MLTQFLVILYINTLLPFFFFNNFSKPQNLCPPVLLKYLTNHMTVLSCCLKALVKVLYLQLLHNPMLLLVYLIYRLVYNIQSTSHLLIYNFNNLSTYKKLTIAGKVKWGIGRHYIYLFSLMGMKNKVKSNWDCRTLNYSNTVCVLLSYQNIIKYN